MKGEVTQKLVAGAPFPFFFGHGWLLLLLAYCVVQCEGEATISGVIELTG